MNERFTKIAVGVTLLVMGGAALGEVARADKAPPPREDKAPAPREDKAPAPPDEDAKTPREGDAATPAEPAPEAPPRVWRIEDTRPKRLPDGVFHGRLEGGGEATAGTELRVTIIGGRVIEAFLRRPAGLPVFDLFPVESGDSLEIRLQGASGSEFVRIHGAFFDAERGAGRFDGVFGRHKTEGTWRVARR